MNAEKMNALVREIRKAADALPAGKKRDVNNKLDRIVLNFKERPKSKTPVPVIGEPDLFGENEHYPSQARAVLAYMEAGNTITSLEALKLFGIISFPRRILDIEKMTGKAPNRRRIAVENRYGKTVYVNEYWIEKEEAQ